MTDAFRTCTVGAVMAALVSVGAQAGPQAPARPDSRRSDVTAILVDVVVRDNTGNPVADLRPDEFVVTEDGQTQKVGSFTPIFKPSAPAESAGGARPAPALVPSRMITPAAAAAPHAPPGSAVAAAAASAPEEVLAIVFDRLTPEARSVAHQAALGYVGRDVRTDKLMAVYGIDLGLVPYQWFTRDGPSVRKAIDSFANRSTSQFGSTREQRMEAREQGLRAGAAQSAAAQTAAGGGAAAGAAGAAIGGAAGDVQFAQMQERTLETFDALERDQRGYSTANALLAVVSSMRSVPGRKAVVFFSEGLSIPPDVQERFIAVVAAANRANVSIYSVDAAGLRTISTSKETRDEIMSAAQRTLSGNPTRDQTGEPMMAALERNENNLRLDPHSGLGMLADQTGGLIVSNTNDFRRGLARVDSDLRNYYMLSYVPSNPEFDGRFREIHVKVSRPGVTVQHRKGYFAVRAPAGVPVLTYEAPALALLDKTPVPNAFPVRAGAMRFPEPDHPGLTPVVVEVPTANLTFEPAPDDPKKYRSDTTVLVRFTNDDGDVLEKMSQRYELTGPLADLERAKSGEVIFYRQPDLPPGVYQMETVVYDALAKKASVRFATVEKPAVDTARLRMSNLLIVRRGEKVPESERIIGSPLYVGDMLLYPNLGLPLKRGEKELAFYFTAYLASAGAGDAAANLELLQNAKPLAQVDVPLAAPDAQGRIRQVGRIPIGQLTPGSYELRAAVRQGGTTVGQSVLFRVTD
jgi:VWFA-related protein